ncbi:MAG: hypothetical protein R3C46_13625 [Hyphomonadaceae bacterium]
MRFGTGVVVGLVALTIGTAGGAAVFAQQQTSGAAVSKDDIGRLRSGSTTSAPKPVGGDDISRLRGASSSAPATFNANDLDGQIQAANARAEVDREQQRILADFERRRSDEQRAIQAAIRAEEDRRNAFAAQVDNLLYACSSARSDCVSTCRDNELASYGGQILGALTGTNPSTTISRTAPACIQQCDRELSRCENNARSGRDYDQAFTGGSALGSAFGGALGAADSGGGGASGGSSSGGGGGYGPAGPSISTPACLAAQQRAEATMRGLGKGSGICQASRDSVTLYSANLQYLEACPAADPGGAQRADMRAKIRQSQAAADASCTSNNGPVYVQPPPGSIVPGSSYPPGGTSGGASRGTTCVAPNGGTCKVQ